MKISLAPISYHWDKNRIEKFYEQVVAWPVDRIYLGEIICSKRREVKLNDWLRIAKKLENSGKEVVLSNLALIEARSETSALKKICDQGYAIEANDWTAVAVATEKQIPFYAGPSLNIYHGQTLALLYQQNLKGWTLPVELSGDDLKALLQHFENIIDYSDNKTTIDCEVFSYGYAPLAYSARCFSARAGDVAKDDCLQRCIQDEEGLLVNSKEDESLFRINGIQTQSASCYNLLPHWQSLQSKGATTLRLSPVAKDMQDLIIQIKNCLLNQKKFITPNNHDFCNGYWFNLSGMDNLII